MFRASTPNSLASPPTPSGKYHVEQDPQFALVHLQFVHWADKLLKVTSLMLCAAIDWAAAAAAGVADAVELLARTLGIARLSASCFLQNLLPTSSSVMRSPSFLNSKTARPFL
jgi:hypothetical protein